MMPHHNKLLTLTLNLENIHSFEIINMKQNRGHARCIASGLKYIYEKKEFDYVIPHGWRWRR